MADTFIATETLYVDHEPAHQPGDTVHPDNVKRHGWEDKVVKAGTKAAEKAAATDQ